MSSAVLSFLAFDDADADDADLDVEPARSTSEFDERDADRWAAVVVAIRIAGTPLLDAISRANAYEIEDGEEPIVEPEPEPIPEPPVSRVRIVSTNRGAILEIVRTRGRVTLDELARELPYLDRPVIRGAICNLLHLRKICGNATDGYRPLDVTQQLPERIVSAIGASPEGLTLDSVRAALGGRVTLRRLSGAIGWLQRAGRIVRVGSVYRIS